jgi:hypothetical protein
MSNWQHRAIRAAELAVGERFWPYGQMKEAAN